MAPTNKSLHFTAMASLVCLAALHLPPATTALDGRSWFVYEGGYADAKLGFTSAVDRAEVPDLAQHESPRDFSTRTDGVWLNHFSYNYSDYGLPRTADHGYGNFPSFPLSVRRVGSSNLDYSTPSLHVYSGQYYAGPSSSFVTNTTELPFFTSMLFFGGQDVELFSSYNHQGSSVCLAWDPWFGDWLFTQLFHVGDIGMEPGDIKSFRFGCSAAAGKLVRPTGVAARRLPDGSVMTVGTRGTTRSTAQ